MKKTQKSLGQELISVLEKAVKDKSSLKRVRATIDVAEKRKRLQLTQVEFANKFHINLKTLRQWEQGTRIPDTTTTAYLHCIFKSPNTIETLLNSETHRQV